MRARRRRANQLFVFLAIAGYGGVVGLSVMRQQLGLEDLLWMLGLTLGLALTVLLARHISRRRERLAPRRRSQRPSGVTRCARCGYDLSGIPPREGVFGGLHMTRLACPECGAVAGGERFRESL